MKELECPSVSWGFILEHSQSLRARGQQGEVFAVHVTCKSPESTERLWKLQQSSGSKMRARYPQMQRSSCADTKVVGSSDNQQTWQQERIGPPLPHRFSSSIIS